MRGTLRHAGILVKDIEESMKIYEAAGFQKVEVEMLTVVKMADKNGAMIELVQGNWHPHICVNWYEDPDGNYIETVEQTGMVSVCPVCEGRKLADKYLKDCKTQGGP